MDGRNVHTTLKPVLQPLFVAIYRRIKLWQGFLCGAGYRPITISSETVFLLRLVEKETDKQKNAYKKLASLPGSRQRPSNHWGDGCSSACITSFKHLCLQGQHAFQPPCFRDCSCQNVQPHALCTPMTIPITRRLSLWFDSTGFQLSASCKADLQADVFASTKLLPINWIDQQKSQLFIRLQYR